MLGFFGSPPPPPPVEKSFFSEHSHLTAFAFGALVMLVVVLLFYMGVKNELHEQLRSLDEEKARKNSTLSDLARQIAEREQCRDRLTKELEKLKADSDRLVQSYTARAVELAKQSEPELVEQLDQLRCQIAVVDDQLKKLDAAKAVLMSELADRVRREVQPEFDRVHMRIDGTVDSAMKGAFMTAQSALQISGEAICTSRAVVSAAKDMHDRGMAAAEACVESSARAIEASRFELTFREDARTGRRGISVGSGSDSSLVQRCLGAS